MRKKILSICIPTYNRARQLNRVLGELSSEIDGMQNELEICISDNASTDNTPEIIEKWKKKLPVRGNRNGRNLGYDCNLIKTIEIAKGEFCWFLGDDDTLVEGSLKKLVKDLKGHRAEPFAGVYINILNKDGSLTTVFNFSDFLVLPIKGKDYPFLSLGSIGSLCIRSELTKKIIREQFQVVNDRLYKKDLGDYALDFFAQTYLFLEVVHKAGYFAIAPYPCTQIVSEGQVISYDYKMYLDLIGMLYAYDVKKHFGWFREGPRHYRLNSHFIRSVILYERPDLKEAFDVNYRLFLKLLTMDGHWVRVIKFFETIRKLPFAGNLFLFAYRIRRNLNGSNNLKNVKNENAWFRKNLEYSIRKAKGMM